MKRLILGIIMLFGCVRTHAQLNTPLLAAAHRRNANTGPVGWWKLNDGSGTTATDSSGNGNNGTLVNSPTWTTGPNSNGALAFTASSDQYVDLGNPSVLQITGAITITTWIKLTNPGDYIIFSKDGITGGRAYTVDYSLDGPSRVFRFYINGGGVDGTNSIKSTTVPSTGTWYFIAATFDPSTSIKIYVNGSLESTGTTSVPSSIPTATSNVLMARRTYTGFTQPLDGVLDDVRVYNSALTASDILTIYTNGAQ